MITLTTNFAPKQKRKYVKKKQIVQKKKPEQKQKDAIPTPEDDDMKINLDDYKEKSRINSRAQNVRRDLNKSISRSPMKIKALLQKEEFTFAASQENQEESYDQSADARGKMTEEPEYASQEQVGKKKTTE